jgi:hypothetical protein
MKSESIKILISEIDYKLGRVDYFEDMLKEWENKNDEDYQKSQRRLVKLKDETVNLLKIMKLEQLDEFKEYHGIFNKLQEHASE